MLATKYSGSGCQYHACWCPGSWSRQSISRHGVGYVRQATCIVIPELISSTWVKLFQNTIQNMNISFVIFKIIQHVYRPDSRQYGLWSMRSTWSTTAPVTTIPCLTSMAPRINITSPANTVGRPSPLKWPLLVMFWPWNLHPTGA